MQLTLRMNVKMEKNYINESKTRKRERIRQSVSTFTDNPYGKYSMIGWFSTPRFIFFSKESGPIYFII